MKKCDKELLDLRTTQQIPNFRQQTVAKITREFLEQIAEALAAGEEVHLPALGRLKVSVDKSHKEVELPKGFYKAGTYQGKRKLTVERQLRVCFAKNNSLYSRLREKYHGNG